jgi:UDP-GlcNAc3NAcA epimerase
MMIMPEEQNRRLTDHLSTWLFCPTEAAMRNLEREGIPGRVPKTPSADEKAVVNCGDIMLEASLYYRTRLGAHRRKNIPEQFYLITLHRAENTDDPARISAIVKALNQFTEIEAVFPMHPRTRKILNALGLAFAPHIHVIDPVGYFDMLALEDACSFVVTDSGGVQKEAYFFQKPCITLRESTEWVELVEHGWNTLTGADSEKIHAALRAMPRYGDSARLYGDGRTSETIANYLVGGN